MKIIGAGFGRTGTLSIKYALEELGFDPCYHMRTVIDEGRAEPWLAILAGKQPKWDEILGGFQAGVDFPVCLYYKELMAEYPDAKVLLSVRDSARWYESVTESIYLLDALPNWMESLPRFGPLLKLARGAIWNGLFRGRFEDRPFAIALFEEHNTEVRRVVPADKLLVFNVQDGWEPLCNFLDVPIADSPFPHVNDRSEMQHRIGILHRLSRIIPAGLGLILVVLIWWLTR